MLEAFRLQFPFVVLFANQDRAPPIGDFTHSRNRHTIDTLRQARNILRSNCEKQFKIFTAVQRQHERIEGAPATEMLDVAVQRQRCRIDDCASSAFIAQVMQIGR